MPVAYLARRSPVECTRLVLVFLTARLRTRNTTMIPRVPVYGGAHTAPLGGAAKHRTRGGIMAAHTW